jgi:hypothetical protein
LKSPFFLRFLRDYLGFAGNFWGKLPKIQPFTFFQKVFV